MAVQEEQRSEAPRTARIEAARQEPQYTDKRAKLHHSVNTEEAVELGTRFEAQAEQIDAAERKTLFDERGRPRVVPEEAARQRAKFNSQRQEALSAFRSRIAETEADSQRLLAEVEAETARYSNDPLEHLSVDELALASARDAWMQKDAAELSLADLAGRIKAATARGDRPSLALWVRYGTRRLETERAAARERGEYAVRPAMHTDLAEALSSAAAVLVGEATLARRKVLAERRQAAESVLKTVANVRRAIDPDVRADLGRRWDIRM